MTSSILLKFRPVDMIVSSIRRSDPNAPLPRKWWTHHIITLGEYTPENKRISRSVRTIVDNHGRKVKESAYKKYIHGINAKTNKGIQSVFLRWKELNPVMSGDITKTGIFYWDARAKDIFETPWTMSKYKKKGLVPNENLFTQAQDQDVVTNAKSAPKKNIMFLRDFLNLLRNSGVGGKYYIKDSWGPYMEINAHVTEDQEIIIRYIVIDFRRQGEGLFGQFMIKLEELSDDLNLAIIFTNVVGPKLLRILTDLEEYMPMKESSAVIGLNWIRYPKSGIYLIKNLH